MTDETNADAADPKDATDATVGTADTPADANAPEGAKGDADTEGAEASADAEGAEGTEGEAVEQVPRLGGKRVRAKRKRRTGRQRDGKLIRDARTKVERHKRYPLTEALELLQTATPKRKFDEAVDICVKLSIDPKKQDQAVRGAVSLPRGIGKELRIIAFAEGDDAAAALEAGAIEAGGKELVEKVKGGWMDFDKAIAAPSMMKLVGGLGRILGPVGKMPTPKDGTVTPRVAEAVKEFRLGKISYRADQYGNVHALMGRRSFEPAALHENIQSFIDHLVANRPSGVKGTFISTISVSSTMGPGIRVEVPHS